MSGPLSGPSAGDSRTGVAGGVTVLSPVTAGVTGAPSPVIAGVVPPAGGAICAAAGKATSNATTRLTGRATSGLMGTDRHIPRARGGPSESVADPQRQAVQQELQRRAGIKDVEGRFHLRSLGAFRLHH